MINKLSRKRKQSRKYVPLNEFRVNRLDIYGRHPQYVFGRTHNGKLKSLGLSHTPDEKHKSHKLNVNPNPSDKKTAYIGETVHTVAENAYDSPKKGWRFSDTDKPLVRHIIKGYKKRTNRKPPNWYVNKKYKKKK